ncbi:Hypothetical protein SMAX5B_020657 [Scophthalmus maximus]|uniref:Uncharacterized protein n=1 Tax=Scophthalmus maximus TaxID=52904 RepID=A0A2U9AZY3_SCOMX|nr:Hypothetical protein SMAX5B_020657 [Scophthalmus maximus]
MEPSTLATQRWKFSVPANVLQQCLHMITDLLVVKDAPLSVGVSVIDIFARSREPVFSRLTVLILSRRLCRETSHRHPHEQQREFTSSYTPTRGQLTQGGGREGRGPPHVGSP